MIADSSFRALIERVRAGEEAAAAELVARYEPTIRRTIRVRLRDPRLRRLFDSMDICQSVLSSFFVRAALGQFDLEQPEQLGQLLMRMARNKLANQVNHQAAGRRDYRRVAGDDRPMLDTPDTADSPSEIVAGKELLAEARRRLSADERRLLELRQERLDWAAIAARVGGSPDGLRMKWARAVERVAGELGLDPVHAP